MRIAHCQLQCTPGDFDANVSKMTAGMQQAENAGAEIVSFPECFLTGYQDNGGEARKHAFTTRSKQFKHVLEVTRAFRPTLVIGFNEVRGDALYNSVLVSHMGKLQGIFSKCTAYMPFHTQGRAFPVFKRGDVTFGILICSDGGYPDPARILALKGAQLIIAPHFNYITGEGLIDHFMGVRADHAARARENKVFFVRGNNVCMTPDPSINKPGIGYGDSYVMDPMGEILVRSRRGVEDLITADIDVSYCEDKAWGIGKNAWSLCEFGRLLQEALDSKK